MEDVLTVFCRDENRDWSATLNSSEMFGFSCRQWYLFYIYWGTCQVCRCLPKNRSMTMQDLSTAAWPVPYSGTLRPDSLGEDHGLGETTNHTVFLHRCPTVQKHVQPLTSDADSNAKNVNAANALNSRQWWHNVDLGRKTRFRPSWLDWDLVDVLQFICIWCRVPFRDDKIGVICILHHITAVGDWSQISGIDGIRGWAYNRTLDVACKDVDKIKELIVEFGVLLRIYSLTHSLLNENRVKMQFIGILQSGWLWTKFLWIHLALNR